ncbi:MAG: hypothetical protein WAV89_05990 [Ignavibacteriaceae bacterium]
MNRKKFFTSISLSAIGLALFNTFPMNIISKKFEKENKKVKVKINPLAVSRKKTGDKNA